MEAVVGILIDYTISYFADFNNILIMIDHYLYLMIGAMFYVS